MDDQEFQKKINQAWVYKNEGKPVESMKLYDELYGQLTKEAAEYARKFDGTTIDDNRARKIMPQYFDKADEYLKRGNIACTILNNMGVILAEAGNKEAARKHFEESIKYTPDGLDYPNPKIGLKELE